MSTYRNPAPVEWAVDSQLRTLSGYFPKRLMVVKNVDSSCLTCSGLLKWRWDIYSQYKKPERVLSAINDKMRELKYNLEQGGHKEYVFKVFDSTVEMHQNNVVVSVLVYQFNANASIQNLVDIHKVLVVDTHGFSSAINDVIYYIK